jgi:hypothetical protein
VELWSWDGAHPLVAEDTQTEGLSETDLAMVGLTRALLDNPKFFASNGWTVGQYSDTKYFEWTVTTDPSYVFDYTTATLDYQIVVSRPFTYEIRSSVDGFTTAIASHRSTADFTSYSDSLAALGVQAGAVSFRLYGQMEAMGGPSGFYGGSMRVTADDGALIAAVPEPANIGLVLTGLVSLGLMLWRRTARARQTPVAKS